jgi:hypothetical protein
MKTVKATREGLIGGTTSTGWKIDRRLPFVALPSTKALYRFVRVRNHENGRTAIAVVMDVGPWNEHDDDYVFGASEPAALTNPGASGRKTNGAGIDLGEAVWAALGMRDNGLVGWEFLDAGQFDIPPAVT